MPMPFGRDGLALGAGRARSLASEGLGNRAAEGSGVICMAIVGGAIVPYITGVAADSVGLKMALIVPAVCYAVILAFGWYARRPTAR